MSYQVTFPVIKALRAAHKDNNAPIWLKLAKLVKSSYKNNVININKIDKQTKEHDVIICPCKVLGTGVMSHKIILASFGISLTAVNKIVYSGGKVVDFTYMINKFPTGQGVMIIE